MTGGERLMTESQLDQILVAWLEEGATIAPDRIADNAVSEIATVPQERDWPDALRASFSSAPLAWAAGILALAVGIGILIGPRLIGGPTPSPDPSPSPDGGTMNLFTSEEDGYQLLIPITWAEVDSGFADARKWSGQDGELMVSYGASIFDGGAVTVCAPPGPSLNTCVQLEHGFSVPFDPQNDGVGPLSMEGWLDRCEGACPVTASNTTLDGESASQDRAVIGDLQLTYVSTYHNRRPVILYWSEPVDLAGPERIDLMRSSFRFIDPPPGSEEPFVDPTELVTYTNAEDGYELLMPRFWLEGEGTRQDPRTNEPVVGLRTFASGRGFGTRDQPALTISIGQPDGSFTVCQRACQEFVAADLQAMGQAVITIAEEFTSIPNGPIEEQGDLVLGGEVARFERPVYPSRQAFNCLGCPWMYYHLYTIHGGRPVLLAFDFWTIEFEAISTDYLTQMLESFRFLD
jgi:hypothetical protein